MKKKSKKVWYSKVNWKTFIFTWFLAAFVISVVSYFHSGIVISKFWDAFILVGMVGLINAVLWPLFSRWFLVITVYTFGIFNLFINGVLILVASEIVDGVQIQSLGAAIWLAFLVTAVNIIFSFIFSIDDDKLYYRQVIRRYLKNKYKIKKKTPGIIYFEIDGLSKNTLKYAINKGFAPTMKRWLQEKSHKITDWETDLSSQTGASQAGILHGNNNDMPAFRWVEKENGGKVMTSNDPNDCPLIEERHSNGKGLLSKNGGSRSNLFSGDASDYVMTYSKLKNLKKIYNPIFYAYFGSPYNFIRTLILASWDFIEEGRSQIRQKVKNVEPRLGFKDKGFAYFILRIFTTVILRDITLYTLIGDILAGERDVVYATFVGYDEVAHHSGVKDIDALVTLRSLDKQLAKLESAAKEAERKYHLVVLSDHGQTNGATFKQRYGITLKDVVEGAMGEGVKVKALLEMNEGWGHLNMVLTDLVQSDDKITGKAARKLLRGRLYKKSVVMGPGQEEIKKDKEISEKDELIVLASGNLGLIYLTNWKRKVTYEEINKAYPNLVLVLAQHKGIGFVMVKSTKYGPLAIGKNGVMHLESGKVEGKNPIRDFGKNTRWHLLRTSKFKHAPDILVNSMYDSKRNEVAAFEGLIGSHGGLGGDQNKPFILIPNEWNKPSEKIVGAERVHRVMKAWFGDLS
ncbi:phage holin family protein [Patescibacteria group bacterium]